MKKNQTPIFNVLFGVFSICLVIAGTILLIASFFDPSIQTLSSIELMFIGALGVFLLLNDFNKKQNSPQNIEKQNSPSKQNKIKTSIININEKTNKEDYEEIIKQIDYMINGFFEPNNIQPSQKKEDISIQQLQKELDKAIENNEFEKAAEIRDLIKMKKEQNQG